VTPFTAARSKTFSASRTKIFNPQNIFLYSVTFIFSARL